MQEDPIRNMQEELRLLCGWQILERRGDLRATAHAPCELIHLGRRPTASTHLPPLGRVVPFPKLFGVLLEQEVERNALVRAVKSEALGEVPVNGPLPLCPEESTERGVPEFAHGIRRAIEPHSFSNLRDLLRRLYPKFVF